MALHLTAAALLRSMVHSFCLSFLRSTSSPAAVGELGSLGHFRVMDTFGIFLFFAVPMLATIPVAVFLCHRRFVQQRGISYGTMFTAASCVPFLLAVVATCIEPSMWWSREGKNVPELWLVMLLFMAAMCVLPALCVAVYYQRRKKRDETPVA
jgi:hypothetical protein